MHENMIHTLTRNTNQYRDWCNGRRLASRQLAFRLLSTTKTCLCHRRCRCLRSHRAHWTTTWKHSSVYTVSSKVHDRFEIGVVRSPAFTYFEFDRAFSYQSKASFENRHIRDSRCYLFSLIVSYCDFAHWIRNLIDIIFVQIVIRFGFDREGKLSLVKWQWKVISIWMWCCDSVCVCRVSNAPLALCYKKLSRQTNQEKKHNTKPNSFD